MIDNKKVMKYEKLDPISHIHKRPDMYVGSLKSMTEEYEWLCASDFSSIYLKENFNYVPGFLRIFVEVISNVIDNIWRSQQQKKECKRIEIGISEDGFSVLNDGLIIPFDEHENGIRIPEMIFGHLLTSSNYDDKEERLTSGRNGLGVKLTNVFSKKFVVEICDSASQKMYIQRWKDNMRICEKPVIKEKKIKSDYVKISWEPDLEKFGIQKIPEDMILLFYRYSVDVSMITKIPIRLNSEKINIKSFMDYVKLYPKKNEKEIVYLSKEENIEVIITSSDIGYKEITFTNGIYNKNGGVHVDTIMTDICRQLLTKINKKQNSMISYKDIKQHFMIFVNSKLINPEFNNQSKERLLSPNIRFSTDPKHIQQILKWSWMEDVQMMIQQKEINKIKKQERKKIKIEGYDPANLSGTRHSDKCVLILCEGLSAKTYAVTGLEIGWNGIRGRDYFGIFPLRGKVLNVRNASVQTIMNNKEITELSQILNLKHKTDYSRNENFNQLNYGRIMILTDSDADGVHIASLLINYFDVLHPSLLSRPFLYLMMTPIAKIKDHVFYNEYEYYKYLEEHSNTTNIKYYKGLGTSNTEEVKNTFGKKVVEFIKDDASASMLDKVFHQKFSNDRKEWLETYNPQSYQQVKQQYPISLYINQELIRFSIDDCRRNIPNLFDGLKLSQRKILFSVFKKGLEKSMKVAQLAGYVAEVSNYHHGEQCLFDTIIKMTQSFVGSNNIPLLVPDGQCGTKSYNGKDAANARYVFTRLQKYTRKIFLEKDDPLYTYVYDDNDKVEPEYYMPIIPMIMVNGCNTGIGTGWSCNMPSYNPMEIIRHVEKWIGWREYKQQYDVKEVNDLKPYYHGFLGKIEKMDKYRFQSFGNLKEIGDGNYKIDEIPIGLWTDKYKEFLEDMVDQKKIKNLKNYSTANKIHFEFKNCPDFQPDHTNMKLNSMIHLSNMVFFTKNHQLRKFNDLSEIFDIFCEERYKYYQSQKKYCLDLLYREQKLLKNKWRFIRYICEKKIVISDYQDDDIDKKLNQLQFDIMDGSFAYLLNIPIRQMTKTRIEQLKQMIARNEQEISDLIKTTEGQLWKMDISDLVKIIQSIFI